MNQKKIVLLVITITNNIGEAGISPVISPNHGKYKNI